jgi:predicted dehydrogenase/threonine dehydrogenase-like Zn-dependent dehydrogenase
MKQLLQNLNDGVTRVVDVPMPSPKPGTALIRTGASLVSAGTERMLVEFAEKNLVGKARSRPDLVKQLLDKARREGVLSTIEAAFNRLDQPITLGYSSAGTIIELGAGLQGFQVGDRVACAGGGHAVHAEFAVVPQNLMVKLPPGIDDEHGAFATLGAVALHGFRLGQPQVGETVAVIGLGLLGLLSVGLARAAGCRVIGVDLDPARVKLAKQIGAEAVLRAEAEAAVAVFTDSLGADIVLIAADTPADDPVELAGEIARDRGRVVAVGAVGMNIPRRTYFYKELDFRVSRSYGPGRYDPIYEEGGVDYPPGFVRWTAGRNMAAFLGLIASGSLDISALITHRFAIQDAPAAYDLITGKSGDLFLGVLLTYSQEEDAQNGSLSQTITLSSRAVPADRIRLGVLGAGNIASAVMLPSLRSLSSIELVSIASASGVSARHAADKHRFQVAASSAEAVIDDPNVNTVAILTRHNLHAAQAVAALAAGKHVFCEKPLALNAEELHGVFQQLEHDDAPLLTVGFNRRFAPHAVKLHDFFAARREPLWAHVRVNAGFLPPDHWLHDPAVGGGRIIGEGVHFIDFLTYLVGAPPVSVTAAALPDGGRYRQDNLTLIFAFSDGSTGTLSYLANGDKSVPKERIEVFSGGRVGVLDDFRALELVVDGRRSRDRSRLRQDKGHKAEWVAFAAAIESGGPPPIPYGHLRGVHLAAYAAMRALQTGQAESIKV